MTENRGLTVTVVLQNMMNSGWNIVTNTLHKCHSECNDVNDVIPYHVNAVLYTRLASKQLQEFLVTKKLKKLDASKVFKSMFEPPVDKLFVVGFSEGNSQAHSESATVSKGAGSLFTSPLLGWGLHGPLPKEH